MISTVKSRPNHYEMLGLTPSAKTGDILQAFARQMGLFQARPMADAAQVGIAYETLRDPAKRKAYDDSLGLNREPRAVAPSAVSFRLSAHFAGSAPVERAERLERVARPAADPVPRPEPEAEPQPRAEAPAERSPGSFIAASLRNSSVPPIPAPSTMEVPERAHIRQVPSSAPTMFRDDEQADADSGPIDWQRPAVAVGGLIAAVALVGAWAGWKAGNDIDPAPPERAVTVALPQAKPPSAVQSETLTTTAPLQRQRRVRATLSRAARAPAADPGLVAEQEPHANPTLRNPPEVNPAEEFAAEAAPVVAASAVVAPVSTASAVSAPLSNATIAHTIGRIGYACGRVVSTSAIEGAGAFKVTCSSGDSYRAAPVRGHYRFKRLGSH